MTSGMSGIKYAFVFLVFALSSVSRSEMRVSLRGEAVSFISQDYENTDQKTFGFFGASLRSDAKKNDPVIVDLTGMYGWGQPTLSYLNIRESYFNYQIDSASKLFEKIRAMALFSRPCHKWFSAQEQMRKTEGHQKKVRKSSKDF